MLWRLTGDEAYREWGWAAFRAWSKFSRVRGSGGGSGTAAAASGTAATANGGSGKQQSSPPVSLGFANLDSVLEVPPRQRDKMESFWVAETLKYLYLMFDDEAAARLPLVSEKSFFFPSVFFSLFFFFSFSRSSLFSTLSLTLYSFVPPRIKKTQQQKQDQYVFNTEAHPLPIRGSAADEAASRGYLSLPLSSPPPEFFSDFGDGDEESSSPLSSSSSSRPGDPVAASDAAEAARAFAERSFLRSRAADWAAAGAAAVAEEEGARARRAAAARGGG